MWDNVRSIADLLERSGIAAVNDGGLDLSARLPLRYLLSPFVIGALIPASAIYLGMLVPTLNLNAGGAF